MAALLLASCGKEYACRTPIGDALCQIEPDSPLYPGLNTVGGFEYLVGGFNGVVVIRTGWTEFVAYERSCPQDSGRLEIVDGSFGCILECPKCHSQWSTFGFGEPLEGSTTSCLLWPYLTYYDGYKLYISN